MSSLSNKKHFASPLNSMDAGVLNASQYTAASSARVSQITVLCDLQVFAYVFPANGQSFSLNSP